MEYYVVCAYFLLAVDDVWTSDLPVLDLHFPNYILFIYFHTIYIYLTVPYCFIVI